LFGPGATEAAARRSGAPGAKEKRKPGRGAGSGEVERRRRRGRAPALPPSPRGGWPGRSGGRFSNTLPLTRGGRRAKRGTQATSGTTRPAARGSSPGAEATCSEERARRTDRRSQSAPALEQRRGRGRPAARRGRKGGWGGLAANAQAQVWLGENQFSCDWW